MTTVEGHRIALTRIHRSENVLLEMPGDAGLRLSGRHSVTMGLSIAPPSPKLMDNIQGLDAKLMGFTDSGRLLSFSHGIAEDQPPEGRSLRVNLWANELDQSVEKISRLSGELLVFPRAVRVGMEFPLREATPLVREAEGLRATLRHATMRGQSLGISVWIEWPKGHVVDFLLPDRTSGHFLGLQALTAGGALLMPNTASHSNDETPQGVRQRFEATFNDLKEPPTRIRFTARVRSGTPQRLKFTLPDIVLPSGQAEPADDDEMAALSEGHPFFQEGGGSLVQPIRYREAEVSGQLLFGLVRLDEPGATCRWFETRREPSGAASIRNLRPGQYRVFRRWLVDGTRSRAVGPAAGVPVELAKGQEHVLPVLDPGGRP